ncbi:MAG: tetratricopeptide repeat protein [Bacteroidetes bacterium]|nr:MAG: tetratricopeptide repeat protein [Bacteroidota bacterium]MBL1145239.1 tetratricopeptide repeat protein [Bacteroidota bacterium]MCB0803175.1 tetratricopeptide repeat protein [Flavobacteriales bacterium]NOG58035.1 tetratricopeptide repeat protein [Bacteroidota bacterium]
MKLNKHLTLALGLGMLTSMSFAQKAKVVSAYNYNKSFERDRDCSELIKGLESIKPATKDPKTMNEAKTWYYGGNLYFNSLISDDEACKKGYPDALTKTYEYYMKALQLNIESPSVSNLDLNKDEDMMKFAQVLNAKDTKHGDLTYKFAIMQNKFPFLANAYINTGVQAFQSKDYEMAKSYSEKSILINGLIGRLDTLGMYNAALASENLKKYDEALTYYSVLSQVGYGGADIYMYMANTLAKKGDTLKRIEVIQAGLEKYPDNSDLMVEELSYLLSSGQSEKAMANFDKAIAAMPNNPSLYYNRGYTYEKLGEIEKAAKDYNKAVEVDPTFFDAAYNLGAMYYNLGVESNNKASSYGLDETAKYEASLKKAKEYFALAMPALEKAHKINPDDQSTMASLISIYSRVGEEGKYNEMKAKIESKR